MNTTNKKIEALAAALHTDKNTIQVDEDTSTLLHGDNVYLVLENSEVVCLSWCGRLVFDLPDPSFEWGRVPIFLWTINKTLFTCFDVSDLTAKQLKRVQAYLKRCRAKMKS